MEDDKSIWQVLKERQKERDLKQQGDNGQIIKDWAKTNSKTIRFINLWQVRISDNKLTMDIYLQSQKYHNITTQRRGRVQNLEAFLNDAFKTKG